MYTMVPHGGYTLADELTKKPETPPLYMIEITKRVIAEIDRRRTTPLAKSMACVGRGFNMRTFAASCGIGYWSMVRYVVRKNLVPPMEVVDKMLYGLGMSILDFIEPREFVSKFNEFGRQTRYDIRRTATSGKSPRRKGCKTVPLVPENVVDTTAE